MARIFITGSADGLGSSVAQRLVSRGHKVVLHARNPKRGQDAVDACPGAENVVVGDLSTISETKMVAEKVNSLGPFDCIIHNAGLYRCAGQVTSDGIPALIAVNILAPYILTALIHRPKRLIFLSSSMHRGGDASMEDILWLQRPKIKYNDDAVYSTSKLHNIMFAKAFARLWPNVVSNALDPGWVATKMGGSYAPGSLEEAIQTYVMLAEGDGDAAQQSGGYFEPSKRQARALPVTDDERLQERLLAICAEFTKVPIA